MDATGIVCTSMGTGHQWVAGLWERDWRLDEWEVPSEEVHETLGRIFSTWIVARMYADPAWWEDDVAVWEGRWPQVASWHMGGSRAVATARAVTAYRGAVARAECTWGGPNGDALRRHALNAVEVPLQSHHSDGGRLHSVSKKTRRSRDCIDLAVAGVLSWQARLDALAAGWTPPRRLRTHTSLSVARRAAEAAEAAAGD